MTFVTPTHPRFIPGTGQQHPRKTGQLMEVPVSHAMQTGLDLFRAGYFWEAHEVWEGLWVHEGRAGPVAHAAKALIKLAAAGVKIVQGQARGVASHIDGALELLAACDKRYVSEVEWTATRAAVMSRRARLEDTSEHAWRAVVVRNDADGAPKSVDDEVAGFAI